MTNNDWFLTLGLFGHRVSACHDPCIRCQVEVIHRPWTVTYLVTLERRETTNKTVKPNIGNTWQDVSTNPCLQPNQLITHLFFFPCQVWTRNVDEALRGAYVTTPPSSTWDGDGVFNAMKGWLTCSQSRLVLESSQMYFFPNRFF